MPRWAQEIKFGSSAGLGCIGEIIRNQEIKTKPRIKGGVEL